MSKNKVFGGFVFRCSNVQMFECCFAVLLLCCFALLLWSIGCCFGLVGRGYWFYSWGKMCCFGVALLCCFGEQDSKTAGGGMRGRSWKCQFVSFHCEK